MERIVLRNMNEICAHMGIGVKRVKQWLRLGAPISVEGDGKKRRYSANAVDLQRWRQAISRAD